ncbi:MAG: hypothetical protein KDA71_15350, partial [Planctomycetales bacterium]|nr:hypothetical protein [Planctomycetales bacterium]
LTVVTHELGHLLGHGDEDAAYSGNSLMTGTLKTGMSRLAGGSFSSPLANSSSGSLSSGSLSSGSLSSGSLSSGSAWSSRSAHDELFGALARDTRRVSATSEATLAALAADRLAASDDSADAAWEATDSGLADDPTLTRARRAKRSGDRQQQELDDLFAQLAVGTEL